MAAQSAELARHRFSIASANSIHDIETGEGDGSRPEAGSSSSWDRPACNSISAIWSWIQAKHQEHTLYYALHAAETVRSPERGSGSQPGGSPSAEGRGFW